MTKTAEKIQKLVQINVEFIQFDNIQTSEQVNPGQMNRFRMKKDHFMTDYNFYIPFAENIKTLLVNRGVEIESQYSLCIEASQWNKEWHYTRADSFIDLKVIQPSQLSKVIKAELNYILCPT